MTAKNEKVEAEAKTEAKEPVIRLKTKDGREYQTPDEREARELIRTRGYRKA